MVGAGQGDLDRLVALEALRQLKARYFRHLDCKEWAQWRTLFTDDAEMDIRGEVGERGGILRGGDAIVAAVSASLASARSVHHGHMAELELTGPDSARGVWAMEDYVEWEAEAGGARAGFRGYGHYHERYRKEEGVWRIAHVLLTRLRRDPLNA